MPTLVLGTRNCKKRSELISLLAPLGLQLATLADFPESIEIDETGDSFAANAALKAALQARHLQQWVLGEDSGLSVAALKGAPGIYSARYSGEGATDERNNERLLRELVGVPLDRRTAHYVCSATLADPTGAIRAASEGICRGRILESPAGSGGFGYDPLFEIVECRQTFGELAPAVKSVLSHRSRAMRALVAPIRELLAAGAWK